jgi:hypothetical protein
MRFFAFLLAASLPFPLFAAQQPAQPRFVLEDGTPVKLVLAETISSADQQKGNLVIFSVAEDVRIGNVVVIPAGANAWGTIRAVKAKGRVGRAGKIEIAIDRVRLADGEKAALSNAEGSTGVSHEGQMATAVAVSSVVAWPAAPLFLLMHGKDVTIPRGTQTLAFVHGDNILDPAKFTPQALAWANGSAPAPAAAPAAAPASSAPEPSAAPAPALSSQTSPAPAQPAAPPAPNDPGPQPQR